VGCLERSNRPGVKRSGSKRSGSAEEAVGDREAELAHLVHAADLAGGYPAAKRFIFRKEQVADYFDGDPDA